MLGNKLIKAMFLFWKVIFKKLFFNYFLYLFAIKKSWSMKNTFRSTENTFQSKENLVLFPGKCYFFLF